MAVSRGEPERDRIPDPAALAQGHRLLRAAAPLELPAWICGSLALLLFILAGLLGRALWFFLLAVALAITLARLLWTANRTPSMRAMMSRGPRLPGEIHDLLALVDSLIDALERGKNRLFERDVLELRLALDRLGPEAQRHLEERGADRARLRHGVCGPDDGIAFSADRRRALHHELLRFGAAARGRPCGDPYRSRTGNGPALLTVVRDPSLARMRRRLAVLLLCVPVIWVAASRGVTALEPAVERMCNPWGDNSHCTLEIDLGVELERWRAALPHLDPGSVLLVLTTLLPAFLLLAAHVARQAGWRSFATALPESEPVSSAPDRRLARARRRQRAARWLGRALVWIAGSLATGAFMIAYAWDARRYGLTPLERIMLAELATMALVLIPTLIAKLEHEHDLHRLQVRIDRSPQAAALLTELSDLRRELEQAAPVRAELLEQLAEALAQAETLGRLSTQAREHVVARLRAGAARGPALDREHRDALLLDVRACEALIGARPA